MDKELFLAYIKLLLNLSSKIFLEITKVSEIDSDKVLYSYISS